MQIAKSIVNHLQSLGLVMSLRAEQQALAQTVLGTLGSLGGPNLGVFSFGCMHHWTFVQIVWLTVALPPIVIDPAFARIAAPVFEVGRLDASPSAKTFGHFT